MNIHIQTLLTKMGEEINLAKSASREEAVREKIYSIKTLCEVILSEGGQGTSGGQRVMPIESAPVRPVYPQPSQMIQQPVRQTQGQKLDLEDGANGDSIFDF